MCVLHQEGAENLVVNNKKNGVFMSRNYIDLIVAPRKFDVFKTSIFALEASLLGRSVGRF